MKTGLRAIFQLQTARLRPSTAMMFHNPHYSKIIAIIPCEAAQFWKTGSVVNAEAVTGKCPSCLVEQPVFPIVPLHNELTSLMACLGRS